MKLQNIISRLQKLHPKEIDLSLDRIKRLCKKLGDPQENLKYISVIGTNGKYSTIQAIRAILKDADINCNIYTSPHIQKINERFIFNDEEISDENLMKLLIEVEDINSGEPITYFEILTAAFFYNAKKFKNNINLLESGLFHRVDACSIIKSNLASVVTAIGLDHLDWLPKDEQTIEKIVYEKTSSLLNSNIIISKQYPLNTTKIIKKTILKNSSNKSFFNEDFSYSNGENGFFYYEDKFGGLKLPMPNILGQFQLENISTAIATLRMVNIGIEDENIKRGITKIKSIARLQEIKTGKLKKLVKDNRLILDGSHNEDGSRVLNEYLQTLDCKKHVIIGMMANKNHQKYISYFKNIESFRTIDIPGQPNCISGMELKNKFKAIKDVQYKENIEQAIKSVPLRENDLLIITGSLYLAGEVLNLN